MNSFHRLRNAFEDAETVLRRNRLAIVEQIAHDPANRALTDAIAAIDAALAQLDDQKNGQRFGHGFFDQ